MGSGHHNGSRRPQWPGTKMGAQGTQGMGITLRSGEHNGAWGTQRGLGTTMGSPLQWGLGTTRVRDFYGSGDPKSPVTPNKTYQFFKKKKAHLSYLQKYSSTNSLLVIIARHPCYGCNVLFVYWRTPPLRPDIIDF